MWMGLADTRTSVYTHVYLKSTNPGWQNAGGDGKHLDRLEAPEQHVNANRGMMAQSQRARKASPLDGKC